ncbi:MAG: HPF/RaiA family ribosome-associated protein [Anaerolineales bacterium]
MVEPEFPIEIHSESDALTPTLIDKIMQRLEEIKGDHTDMVGAAVNVREIAKGEDSRFEFKVIAYTRPDQTVASEKSNNIRTAMNGALDALERQIRDKREKLKEHWKRPDLRDDSEIIP